MVVVVAVLAVSSVHDPCYFMSSVHSQVTLTACMYLEELCTYVYRVSDAAGKLELLPCRIVWTCLFIVHLETRHSDDIHFSCLIHSLDITERAGHAESIALIPALQVSKRGSHEWVSRVH